MSLRLVTAAALAFGAALALPSLAQAGTPDALATKVSIQRDVPAPGGSIQFTMVRAGVKQVTTQPGRLVFTLEGTKETGNVVVTNPGGPGVLPEASGAGFAACTGVSDRSRVTCPAADVVAVQALLDSSDDVVDASGVPLLLSADGKAGNDTITSGTGSGQNFVTGGPGNDTLIGGPGQDVVSGDVRNSNSVVGNDTIIANGGPDIISAGPGSDLVDGGPGIDSFDYSSQTGPAVVTLADGLCNDGTPSDTAAIGAPAPAGCSANGVDRDLLRNVDFVGGSRGDDDIIGGPAAENLFGNAGADRLEGGSGADTLRGSNQADALFARDGVVDTATTCGQVPDDRTAGDRAVVDPDDPVDPSCVVVERGAFATPGPIGTPPAPAPQPPPPGLIALPPTSPDFPIPPEIFQPTPTPTITPDVPTTGAEGTKPGGGDGGKTAPELQITSPNATVSKAGVAGLRVRCVYRAKACVGTIRLIARRAAAAGKGRKRVTVKKGAVLGSATVNIPWGKSAPTNIRVSSAVRRLFAAGAKSLDATAEVRARDGGAGAKAAEAKVTRAVRLGAPGRKR